MRDLTHLHSMETGVENPFTDDLFVDHPEDLPGVARIHHRVYNRAVEAAEALLSRTQDRDPAERIGRLMLVTAPEAGFGKSHLAARLRDRLSTSVCVLSLPLEPSRQVSWPVVLASVLRQFTHHSSVKHEGYSLFEVIGRGFLAKLVRNQLENGQASDCPEPSASLQTDYVELFASDSPSSLLNWTDSHSRELTNEVSPEFRALTGLSKSELGFWSRLLIDFNWRGDSALDPLRGLSNGEARERLLQCLRIASLNQPILIQVDGLDGFFQSTSAGMEIAEILTSIREGVPRSLTLLSMNCDVWHSVFDKQIPSAWMDRLTGDSQKLRSLPPEIAAELIHFRLARTQVEAAGAEAFVKRLENDHLWMDAETQLSPRKALRQAKQLWQRESKTFLDWNQKEIDEPESENDESDLSEFTDKAEFFQALSNDPGIIQNPPREIQSLTDDKVGTRDKEAEVENPFFTLPETTASNELAGIDSIIDDIRGSGQTVISESGNADPFSEPATPPHRESPEPEDIERGFPEEIPQSGIKVGEIELKPIVEEGPLDQEVSLGQPTPFGIPQSAEVIDSRAVSRADIESMLKKRESDLLAAGGQQLDLPRVENFIKAMGANHLGLNQLEERFPSSRTSCLRWQVRGQSVLIGFESPQNVYFWNNLLQQSLSSSKLEKIAAFSHASDSFTPDLFANFGFSPAVIRGKIDAIELSDEELSVLYASESVLTEFESTEDANTVGQFIAMHLDPLWRRISRKL
ncbi:MAG: hypothetical protein AAGA96_19070 [Verrucomicrobiota bacterium]